MKRINNIKFNEYLAVIASMFMLLADTISFAYRLSLGKIKSYYIVDLSFELLGIIVLTIILIGCVLDLNKKDRSNYMYMLIAFEVIFTLFSDSFSWISDGNKNLVQINMLSNTIYYAMVSLVTVSFWRYVLSIVPRVPKWAKRTTIFFYIMYATYLFSLLANIHHCYYFKIENGCYVRGKFYFVAYLFSVVIFLAVIAVVLIQNMDGFEKFSLLVYPLFPAFLMLVQTKYYSLSAVPISMVIATVVIFVNVYIHRGQVTVNNEMKVKDDQKYIMLSQMKPHFLYNTLSSIAALCDINPKDAQNLTFVFSDYLRQNMRSIDIDGTVPFKEAFEHAKNYIDIEQVRFGDLVNVKYDIRSTNFELPPLSIQPLIENAVKHGIGQKEDGGTIELFTFEDEENNYIIVADDGVGFDVKNTKFPKNSGIKNTRHRLKILCKGTLDIESEIGKGTTVKLTIPKIDEEEKENDNISS